jgi:hypothetical protein
VDGVGSYAAFDTIRHVLPSSDGTKLYVADSANHCVRHVDMKTNRVTTVYRDLDAAWSLVFDPGAAIPESQLIVCYRNSICRLQLVTSSLDIMKTEFFSTVESSLLRDLWVMVSNYLVVTENESTFIGRPQTSNGQGIDPAASAITPDRTHFIAHQSNLYHRNLESVSPFYSLISIDDASRHHLKTMALALIVPMDTFAHGISDVSIDTLNRCCYGFSNQQSDSLVCVPLPSSMFESCPKRL